MVAMPEAAPTSVAIATSHSSLRRISPRRKTSPSMAIRMTRECRRAALATAGSGWVITSTALTALSSIWRRLRLRGVQSRA